MTTNAQQVHSANSEGRGDEVASSDAWADHRAEASEVDGDEEEHAAESRNAPSRFGQLMKTPSAGAAISGTLVLGAAAVFGVLETSVAAGAAYFAYRLLRKKPESNR
jgi:hypothetical protein